MSFIRFGSTAIVGLSAVSMSALNATPILNESTSSSSTRRRFYEDESNIVPIPGTVTAAPATELEGVLGANRLIDGISVRSPSQLESFFKSSRESLFSLYNCSLSYLDAGYAKYHNTEKKLTTTVSDLHAKQEDLLPNGIYVIIATLLGNIFARQRGVVAKLTFPVIFGLASFKYFLPETFSRSLNFTWRLEQQHLPQLAETQVSALENTQSLVSLLEKTTTTSQLKVQEGVNSFRRSIANVTGLNLDEEVSKK